MDATQLKLLLSRTIDIDVDATWSDFLEEEDAADADRFLTFLKERRLIDDTTFVELHAQEGIEVEDAPQPAQVSRYRVIGRVAEGAMGVVDIARDLNLRRKVAYKTMIKPGAVPRRRFLHEVQITAQLDHPNVVPVYSWERDAEGRLAYAMKLVRGRTLAQILAEAQKAPRPLPEHLRLSARLDHFRKVCDAVAYAHSKGVIHRDLKPENVMVGRFGEVYVMDWGIAKLIGSDDPTATLVEIPEDPDEPLGHRQTRAGALLGSPAYMSPEQASGQVAQMGVQSDVFTLGLVLHEIAYLSFAYGGRDPVEVIHKAAEGRIDPPQAPMEPVAPDLQAIIRKATARSPLDRYPSVEALEADLRRFLRGEETLALPDTPLRRVRRWAGRHPGATLGAVAAIVLLSLFAATAQVTFDRQRSLEREQRVSDLVGSVSARARRVDLEFLRYEGMLEGIGAAAIYALEHGRPTEGPFFDAEAFRDPSTAPADLTFSPRYHKPISGSFPVYKVAPGVDEALWRPDLGLVDGLRETLRRVFPVVGSESPMRWSYVALERSGLMFMFPGAAGWDAKYDPRTRPWYRDAVGARGKVWGKPYVDLMGQGRLLSCVLPLYGEDDTFLGVAGIDLQFDELLDEVLKMTDLDGYESAYLLDGDRVVMATTIEHDPFVVPPTEVLDDGIDLGAFDRAEVLAAARDGRAGHLAVDDHLFVWAPLQHNGWTYVVSLEESSLE